ncbi:MAG: 5'/3'-nucleotidase SurE [Acidobacteria bacterium]|nr:MAG: 5'/3'-nucleotidase SurE [Acidobacteriota bacterium]
MAGRDATVLLTNDDGIRAAGLRVLAEAFESRYDRVVVVAPDREQSGASHALTIRSPLRVERLSERWYAVEGTPTDCVNLAFHEVLEEPPHLVVSGINRGYNLGDDVTYSGTVAGALEGRILGAQGLAVSTDPEAGEELYREAARIALDLAERLLDGGLPRDGFLNVNVPPGARGFRVTRQGRRRYRKGLIARRDPKGREYYWIGLAPSEWEPDPKADHTAVADGYVSVTPLHSDLTHHRAIPVVEGWGLPQEGP